MICPKCAQINDNNDRFCYKCGAPLTEGGAEQSAQGQQQGAPTTDSSALATINAKTMLAAREARKADISAMRPVTRAAYNIVESERGGTIIGIITVLYGIFCLGMVATLIKIFETISKLGESFASSGIEGSLSEKFYGASSNNNAQLLLWLIVLFVVMAIGFFVCGKLNIRIRKVSRKKKREQLDSRL